MEYQVRLEQAASQTTAVVRCQAAPGTLTTVIPQLCGEVWSFLRAAQVPGAGRHVALYLDGAINLECGAEVAQPFVGDSRVVCSSTPAGTVATTMHIGPYNLLHGAHNAVVTWCAANGHALAGPNWEVYGHWRDDEEPRTDVYYLLQPGAPGG
jgi:effector-binding domain-containing protein